MKTNSNDKDESRKRSPLEINPEELQTNPDDLEITQDDLDKLAAEPDLEDCRPVVEELIHIGTSVFYLIETSNEVPWEFKNALSTLQEQFALQSEIAVQLTRKEACHA